MADELKLYFRPSGREQTAWRRALFYFWPNPDAAGDVDAHQPAKSKEAL